MTIPMRREEALPTPSTVEDVLIKGDLSKLTEEQRTEYYMRVCKSVGLNHLTQPFDYMTLNGKLRLYAKRDAADQLRKIHGISIKILSQEKVGGLLVIHVHAKASDGREDEDLGAVSWGDYLKGEAAANQMLKCVTKAKRRVTLSIVGLGFLDETEVEDIPASAKAPPSTPPAPLGAKQIEHDPDTGEVPMEPCTIAVPLAENGKKNWVKYGGNLINHFKLSKDKREIDKWLELNEKPLDEMEKEAPKAFKSVMAASGTKA